MLRVALAIGTRVQGLLGIAAAPDFTRDLISRDLGADQQAREVPWQTALRLSERLKATDVRVQLLKDGDHRLSRPEQLALMSDTLTELIHTVESVSARTAIV